MAKKSVGASKVPPKSEARPLGTKATPKVKPGAKVKPKPEPKVGTGVHEREATAGELGLIEKRRKTAAGYLAHRDGMDEELAAMVVEGMDPGELGDLYEEAQAQAGEEEQAIAAGAAEANAPPEGAIPDYTEIPALAEVDDFPTLLLSCIEDAGIKNSAEARYKTNKAKLIELLKSAGVNRNEPLLAFGNKLERYQGTSPKQLDPHKLLEKGVSIDIINACYKSTKYEDVRITVPK